jgi:hypothetical protein
MYFVDTIAGGGKTHAAIAYAAEHAVPLGQKIIISQPSRHLINQSLVGMDERFPDVRATAIHSGTDPQEVLGTIIRFLKQAAGRNAGEVLFVTHAALERIPHSIRRTYAHQWHLIVDEVLSSTTCHTHNGLPRGIRMSLRALPQGPAYSRVEVSNRPLWRRIARGETRSPALQEFRDLALDLLNPHKTVHVLTSQWFRSAEPDAQVSFYSLLQPTLLSGFASEPVIMSACMGDTLLYRLWTMTGVEWKPHAAITNRLRATAHTNGPLLTLRYATERDWSKRLRDEKASSDAGCTVQEAMRDASVNLFGAVPHVYMVNRDAEELMEGTGTKLPNSPHGLNQFQHIDNAVIYSALNLSPGHIRFLDSRGISSDEVRGAITYQATYQAALRTSLRDVESTTPKSMVVQDRGCAQYIAALFPGCQVEKLASDIRVGNKPAGKGRGRDVCPADRMKALREEKKLRLAVGTELVNGFGDAGGAAEYCVHTLKDSLVGERKTPLIGMSLFEDKRSSMPFATIPWMSVDAFIADLRTMSHLVHARKEDNRLISPSIFDPELAARANGEKATKRGRINVVSSVGIWLDNDGGDLSVDEFVDLFPHYRIVVYNSYSSTPEARRWRVFIPTSHAMTADLYLEITNQLKVVIEQAGYRSKMWLLKWIIEYIRNHGGREPSEVPFRCHGFDWSKTMPENLMYLPCRAADPRPGASFFHDFNDGIRKPLDVADAIEFSILNERPTPGPDHEAHLVQYAASSFPEIPESASPQLREIALALRARHEAEFETRKAQRITAAINAWRSAPIGFGNQSFCQLGIALKRAGMTLAEVQSTLLAEASQGHSPAERKAQVKNVVDWIRKKGI